MPRPPTFRIMLVLSLSGFLGGVACFWLIDRGSSASAAGTAGANQGAPAVKGWQKGKGWGWIWGKEDEVGSLNALRRRVGRRPSSWRPAARSSTWARPTA